MQNRRDLLETATLAAFGSGLVTRQTLAGKSLLSTIHINKLNLEEKVKMTLFPYELKLKHAFTVATCSRTITPDMQVEIGYEDVTGYGEVSIPPHLRETVESVMNFLRKVNLEQFSNPFQLDDVLSYVDGLLPEDTVTKAAVDIALHDLVGKLLGAPWCRIWGLNKEEMPSATFTMGIGAPDVVRAKTKECADQFNILRAKLGQNNDKEIIETIRSVTNLPVVIDANQGWADRRYTLDMIHRLKEKGVVVVEQPMSREKLEDIAWMTQQNPLPIFTNEFSQRPGGVAALRGAFTGANIKPTKCTDTREAWKTVTLTHALGTRVMVDCITETSCTISAASQFSPLVDFADLDGNLLISNDRFKGVEVMREEITLNDLPGIDVMKI